MANSGIYQHFRSEEYSFIEKIDDIARRVDETYMFFVTEFLNPRQVTILQSVVGQYNLKSYTSSDYFPTEYSRVIIAPEYYELVHDDFELALLEINYNSKFNHLSHSQIMGTLINQLGIKRSVLGDILVDDGYAQLLVERGLVAYFQQTVSKVGKASVTLRELPLERMIVSKKDWQSVDILVSSMRLDKIVATTLKISRQQAVQLISADKVKVNYQLFNKASELLQVGDLISVRGYGRFSLVRDNGLSKNGKFKLTIDKMIHK